VKSIKIENYQQEYFKKSFSIADNCEVKGAELKDGLLRVSLERLIPEAQKPRVIDIK
jgi:molecular chaperone IbpA